MKKNFGLFIGAAMILVSIYGLFIAPGLRKEKVDEQTVAAKEAVEEAQKQSSESVIETEETKTEEIIEETPVKFDISFCKKMFDYRTASESEYLEAPFAGLIQVPESNIEVAVRYGTKYKANIDGAAGLTEFSTNDRLYILGHNYKDGSMFHNLVNTQVGEEVVLTLVNAGVSTEYRFSVVFTKQYTEAAYEADNARLITDNSDYEEEYDLVLVTCNHYPDGTKGRQVVLCQLLEE